MIRYLKVLLGAALALTAFGALSASAHAAEERFHCSVEPCTLTLKPDGAVGSKTAHHVFEVTDGTNTVSFTCNQLAGHATSKTKTTNEVTFTKLEYKECGGITPIVVRTNNCAYTFKGLAEGKGEVTIECEAGKTIEVEIVETKCIMTISTQIGKDFLPGIKFHNIFAVDKEGKKIANTTEVTVESNVEGIQVTAHGTQKQCIVDPAKVLTGHYSTGNTLVTGETDPGGVMAEAWYE